MRGARLPNLHRLRGAPGQPGRNPVCSMISQQKVAAMIRAESVLVDKNAIGEMYNTALKFVGMGVGGILYTAGKQGGIGGARLLRDKLGYEGDDLVEAALTAFNQSNWGHATLVRDAPQMFITVDHSTLAAAVPAQKRAVCHPIAGYLAGFLEEAWHRPVKLHEVECIAVGHALCRFNFE